MDGRIFAEMEAFGNKDVDMQRGDSNRVERTRLDDVRHKCNKRIYRVKSGIILTSGMVYDIIPVEKVRMFDL